MAILREIWGLIRSIWGGFNFETRAIFIAVTGGLLLLLIVFGRIEACRSVREERKTEDVKANIAVREIEANVLTNTRVEVEGNANAANADLGVVLGTDSNKRSDDFGTVKRRWCEDHPGDSKCGR